MNRHSLVQRIQDILAKYRDIPQELKDELILLGLVEVLQAFEDYGSRLEFLEKYKPYLQVLSWAVGIVAVALVTMAVTGRLNISVEP